MSSYITVSGDCWDLIAYKALGSEKYMDQLIKSNLQYKDVAVFSAGVELVIPEVKVVASSKLPPWKRGVR